MRKLIAAFLAVLAGALAGCVSVEEINKANRAIDAEWKREYDALAARDGARVYAIYQDDAYRAMEATLVGLGLEVLARDRRQGRITAFGVGPKPLDDQEWARAEAVDLPRMKDIIAREIGAISAALFTMRPDAYTLTFTATIATAERGTKISVAGRLDRIGQTQPGTVWPTHPPPEAIRIGLPKIWARFEAELNRLGKSTTPVSGRAADVAWRR
jgi:hypothetical protein